MLNGVSIIRILRVAGSIKTSYYFNVVYIDKPLYTVSHLRSSKRCGYSERTISPHRTNDWQILNVAKRQNQITLESATEARKTAYVKGSHDTMRTIVDIISSNLCIILFIIIVFSEIFILLWNIIRKQIMIFFTLFQMQTYHFYVMSYFIYNN